MQRRGTRSFTKFGEIYISPCNHTSALFPINISPDDWSSCDDAYEFTWTEDISKDLMGLSALDRKKLARSMGFCPQDRCQLGNITSAPSNGHCPEGLCYTKLENGGKSFGACCFDNNTFNSGEIIGYQHKFINNPKPIYKRSRVILGDVIGGGNESGEAFINANELSKGLIVTQCPMQSTVADVQQMIVEQNISLWIQLSPTATSEQSFRDAYDVQSDMQCKVFPNTYLNLTETQYNDNYHFGTFRSISNEAMGFLGESFRVQDFDIEYRKESLEDADSASETILSSSSSSSIPRRFDTSISNGKTSLLEYGDGDAAGAGLGNAVISTTTTDSVAAAAPAVASHVSASLTEVAPVAAALSENHSNSNGFTDNKIAAIDAYINGQGTETQQQVLSVESKQQPQVAYFKNHKVRHIWYTHWRDFDVPDDKDAKDLLHTVDLAANVIANGGTVAVNCYSGRGRSGTFASLVMGRLHKITTHSELVDIVVRLRENRDGIVETPQQFRYVSKLLALPSTAVPCAGLCGWHRQWEESEANRLGVAFLAGALLMLAPVLIILQFVRRPQYQSAKCTSFSSPGSSREYSYHQISKE